MQRELERLHVLTLAAEEAVRTDQWDVLSSLLSERDRLLRALESRGVDPAGRQALERARQADARLVQALADARAGTVDEIARAFAGRRVATAYTAQTRAPLTDRVG